MLNYNLFADFLFKFLNGSAENIEMFYTSILPDKVCGTFNFDELIPYGARLLSVLLKNDTSEEKQLIIEHLTCLYNNYESLYLTSKRTIENGELDNSPLKLDKAFNNGDLNNNEFNKIINVLIKNYRECYFYYELHPDSIKVVFPKRNLSDDKKEKILRLKEKKTKVYITVNKIKEQIKNIKSIRELLTAKGYTKAVRISNTIKNTINKINKNEPCCWCFPSENTKHKCNYCRQLNKDYLELIKKYPSMPKNLNQIIKRVHKHHTESNINDLRKAIRDKILEICNKNSSQATSSFINSLSLWYKNI